MAPLTLALLILLALGAGAAFVWGAPIFGIPLLLIGIGVAAFGMFAARTKRAGDIHQQLERSKERKTDFTERDWQTLAQ